MQQSSGKIGLLSVVELGGYPNFTPLYESLGYRVRAVASVRKALRYLKTEVPQVVVAEFNFQSDFRDRTSSLESLLAVIQAQATTKVVVFYEKDQAHQLQRLQAVYPIYGAMAYPIDETALEECLRGILEDNT